LGFKGLTKQHNAPPYVRHRRPWSLPLGGGEVPTRGELVSSGAQLQAALLVECRPSRGSLYITLGVEKQTSLRVFWQIQN